MTADTRQYIVEGAALAVDRVLEGYTQHIRAVKAWNLRLQPYGLVIRKIDGQTDWYLVDERKSGKDRFVFSADDWEEVLAAALDYDRDKEHDTVDLHLPPKGLPGAKG